MEHISFPNKSSWSWAYTAKFSESFSFFFIVPQLGWLMMMMMMLIFHVFTYQCVFIVRLNYEYLTSINICGMKRISMKIHSPNAFILERYTHKVWSGFLFSSVFFFFTNLRCFFCFLLQLGWFLFSFFDSWCELCHPNTHSKKYSSSITFITECRPNSYDDFLEHTRLWSPSCAHKHAKYAESDISSYLLIPNVY